VTIVVNVSDAKLSADLEAVIATYSLGSCIGVSLYDPLKRIGGMLHFQLPSSSIDANRAKQLPTMFADTGMEHLLKQMEALGAERKRMKVKLAGAAQMLNDAAMFNIGKRNHAAIRKILWQQGMFIDGEDVGGNAPRNLYLKVSDGEVIIKTQGQVVKL
jgi:chemotaxis protein CheD